MTRRLDPGVVLWPERTVLTTDAIVSRRPAVSCPDDVVRHPLDQRRTAPAATAPIPACTDARTTRVART